jgi:hypothetical protein
MNATEAMETLKMLANINDDPGRFYCSSYSFYNINNREIV